MSFFICDGLKEIDNRYRAQRRQDYRKMKKAAQREMLIEQKNLQLDNPFIVLNDNDILWRYYNNPDYFVSLLDKGLFFTKIVLFEDKTEGMKCIRLFRPQFRKVKIRFVVEIP